LGRDFKIDDLFMLERQCVEELASEERAKTIFATTKTVEAAFPLPSEREMKPHK